MRTLIPLILSIFSISLFSNTLLTLDKFEYEKRMDFFNVPNVSIGIIKDKKILKLQSYGPGEVDVYQVSGFSKPIVSVAVFKLIEEGLLDLDTDVNEYLDDWKISVNAVTRYRKVTLRTLLSHTSGIHESQPMGFNKEFPTLNELLNKIHIRYYPGLKRRYSWSGFTIIQKVIEDVTGESFVNYMDREILSPLGMGNSSYKVPTSKVLGHDLFGKEIDNGYKYYPELAALGLWSTAEDISKFIIEIEEILTSDYEGILSKASIENMLSYQKGGWGLGISLKFTGEDLIFRHTGFSSGYISYFIARPYRGDGLVILTNSDNAWKLIMEILHSIESYKKWGI